MVRTMRVADASSTLMESTSKRVFTPGLTKPARRECGSFPVSMTTPPGDLGNL
jgi:hypothetical protein